MGLMRRKRKDPSDIVCDHEIDKHDGMSEDDESKRQDDVDRGWRRFVVGRKGSGWHELLWMAAFSTCLKLMMVPSYHSTDFEVHRHWLAITHSLPLKEWYLDETSEWTLDYPPFFAWFERFLAVFASRWDPQMVDLVRGLNYDNDSVVLFQRLTVMVADVVLYLGLWRFCRDFTVGKQRIIYACVMLSPGLLIVDHMHFQYNGFLLGILMLSLACLRDGKDLEGGMWFAVLVCFKHLFAVAGPVYFVYLLRHYCRGPSAFFNFLKLGSAVLFIVGAAFGPFAYYGQMGQLLRRLFPFGRGLSHAYWAPNAWAIWNTADKVLGMILRKFGIAAHSPKAGLTGGLVGDLSPYAVLPQITPSVTAGLVLFALLPCLIKLWRKPKQSEVVQCVVYAYTCGFMFGWHVHEKASLQFVIPMSLMALESMEASGDFLFLSTVSYYSLFPLLFEVREYPVKVLLLIIYTLGMKIYLSSYFENLLFHKVQKADEGRTSHHDVDTGGYSLASVESKHDDHYGLSSRFDSIGLYRSLYLWGLVPLELYAQFLHRLLFKGQLPFVPLLLMSLYCSLGIFYGWAKMLTSTIPTLKRD